MLYTCCEECEARGLGLERLGFGARVEDGDKLWRQCNGEVWSRDEMYSVVAGRETLAKPVTGLKDLE